MEKEKEVVAQKVAPSTVKSNPKNMVVFHSKDKRNASIPLDTANNDNQKQINNYRMQGWIEKKSS